MPAEAQKNLILAMSYGYSYEQLYPFLQSLKETGFDGEIVIFVGGTSVATMDRLRHAGVELKPFIYPFKRAHEMRKPNPLYRLWPLARQFVGRLDSPESIARWSFPFHDIFSLRFLLYYWFLRGRPNRYRHIFFTDLRDVTFQRNPFIHAEGSRLRFYVEEPRKSCARSAVTASSAPALRWAITIPSSATSRNTCSPCARRAASCGRASTRASTITLPTKNSPISSLSAPTANRKCSRWVTCRATRSYRATNKAN